MPESVGLYALLCNHGANLYQATASRRDEILAILGYAWGHLTLLAGSVFRYYMPSSTLRNLVNVR